MMNIEFTRPRECPHYFIVQVFRLGLLVTPAILFV
jgi:hypothetical protein